MSSNKFRNDSGMPNPVTQKSSKKKLWEELQVARNEIDSQQTFLNDLRAASEGKDAVIKAKDRVIDGQRYQLSLIRNVLSVTCE